MKIGWIYIIRYNIIFIKYTNKNLIKNNNNKNFECNIIFKIIFQYFDIFYVCFFLIFKF